MPLYSYIARDRLGNKVEGTLEAQSDKALADQLASRQITPIKIKETKGKAASKNINLFPKKVVSPEEMILFCRQMAAMMKSGIPIVSGLRGVAESIENRTFAAILIDISHHLEAGTSLTQAMHLQENVFDDLTISFINVGEETGKLEKAFSYTIKSLEMERDTKRRIKAATRYPSIVIGAIALALIVVNIYVIPSFEGVFAKLGGDLPLPTQILLATSSFMTNYGLLLLAGLVGLYLYFKQYTATKKGALWWGEKQLNLFIVGSLIKRIIMGRFARTLAMLISSGMPMVQSLKVTMSIVNNAYIAQKIDDIRHGIEEGANMSRVVANTEMFTPIIVQMITVGEETGQMDQLLDHVADFYEEEIDHELEQLSARMEPVILLSMGVLVLVLVMGIFLPIWQIYEQFQ